MLAPFSLFLLNNAGKLLCTGNFKLLNLYLLNLLDLQNSGVRTPNNVRTKGIQPLLVDPTQVESKKLMLAPFSLFLLNNAGKLLCTGNFKLLNLYLLNLLDLQNPGVRTPNNVRTKGIQPLLVDPTQVESKKFSEIQWPVPSINAELVEVFPGE